jgi:hypothetical protein
MNLVLTNCVLFLFAGLSLPTITPSELQSLVAASNRGITDVELMYEGSVLLDKSIMTPMKTNRNYHFQGTFAYRKDGVSHIELDIDKTLFGGGHVTSRYCTNNYKVFESNVDPDNRIDNPNYSAKPGGIPSMNKPASYLRMYFVPLLGFSQHYYHDNTCNVIGWESIDNAKCLHVEFSQGSVVDKYWLDVSRGGNALKYELNVNGITRYVVNNVVLEQVDFPGNDAVWLPIQCTVSTHLNRDLSYSPTPIYNEVYKVLDGSILLNKGLPDSRFTIDWNSTRKPRLVSGASKKSLKRGNSPIDIKSIDNDLNSKLSIANEQSEQLSTKDSSSTSLTTLLQVTGIALGTIFLGAAVFLKWRNG